MAILSRHQLKTFCAKALAMFCCLVFGSTLIGLCGCQTVSPKGIGSPSKSVSAIAQESLQAAEHGGFETIGNQTSASTPGQPISTTTRIRSPRRIIPRKSANRVNRGPNGTALIDEIFDQTDVREALQAIASQADVSIIVDDLVTGTVTTLIQNEPMEQALQKILLPLGHHYRVVNGQYMVCSSDPSSPMFSMISDRLDYSPVNSSPKELVDLLSEKNQQFIRIAPKRNMIIVEAPSKIANQIVEELRLFDRPVPQVVLEAMVVVVSPDSGFKFGTNVGQGFTQDDNNFNFNLDGLELSGNLSGDAISNLFSNFALTSFFVRALEQEGYLSIRATPHVMAKNGEKAEISIARESFFSTQPLSVTAQTFFRQDIQKVEAGISLIITPTIRGDNVTMVIEKAEVSEDIRATVNDPAVNNPYPLINRRQVSTTVHVENGETVVIGGLMQNQMVDRVSRVPILGDIPLLGRLFTQVVQEEEAAEVVVFISPRIVNKGADHPMSGVVDSAQAYNEFCYQRQYPRNNGLDIGGPAQHTHVSQYEQLPAEQPMYMDAPAPMQTMPAKQQIPVESAPPQYVPAASQGEIQPSNHIQMPAQSYQQLLIPQQTYHPQTLQNHLNPDMEYEDDLTVVPTPNDEEVGLTLEPSQVRTSLSTSGNRRILRARPQVATQTYEKPTYESAAVTSARFVQRPVNNTGHR